MEVKIDHFHTQIIVFLCKMPICFIILNKTYIIKSIQQMNKKKSIRHTNIVIIIHFLSIATTSVQNTSFLLFSYTLSVASSSFQDVNYHHGLITIIKMGNIGCICFRKMCGPSKLFAVLLVQRRNWQKLSGCRPHFSRLDRHARNAHTPNGGCRRRSCRSYFAAHTMGETCEK